MSVGYTWVQWNRHKRVYDAVMATGVLAYLGVYALVTRVVFGQEHAPSPEITAIRALASCAIVLVHIVLCIGPLARLDTRFLPLLYNRRHLGVCTFLIALAHAGLVIGFYHGFGVVNPLVSVLVNSSSAASLRGFPFEWPGAVALVILFLMAATSHDFWLKTFSARTWKGLHMLVYPAYALLVAHVALGALQSERDWLTAILLGVGVALVCGLQLAAGWRERARDTGVRASGDDWLDVGAPADIPVERARVVCARGGERIAVFRHANGISAVTNVCAHQGGPLGEGKIIDGCVTCPWHGWQYRAEDGCSPPPFTEKIATYPVRITAGRVQVRTRALPPGTPTAPAIAAGEARHV